MTDRRGFSLLELLVVMAIIALLAGLILAGVQNVRGAAAKVDCGNRLRQLALATLQHSDQKCVLPSGCTVNDGDSPTAYAGYQVFLLPYVEQDALYTQALEDFARATWFDNAPTHRGLSTTIPMFVCPADSRISKSRLVPSRSVTAAFTSYLGVCGTDCMVPKPDGVLFTDSAIRQTDITDGLSNTLLIGERPPSGDFVYGWWYAGIGQQNCGSTDMILGVRERNFNGSLPCPNVAGYFHASSTSETCNIFHFWSVHRTGAHFAFNDGSVRFLNYSANEIMPALATRAGGEAVEVP